MLDDDIDGFARSKIILYLSIILSSIRYKTNVFNIVICILFVLNMEKTQKG